jgi:hypothetical protein
MWHTGDGEDKNAAVAFAAEVCNGVNDDRGVFSVRRRMLCLPTSERRRLWLAVQRPQAVELDCIPSR